MDGGMGAMTVSATMTDDVVRRSLSTRSRDAPDTETTTTQEDNFGVPRLGKPSDADVRAVHPLDTGPSVPAAGPRTETRRSTPYQRADILNPIRSSGARLLLSSPC